MIGPPGLVATVAAAVIAQEPPPPADDETAVVAIGPGRSPVFEIDESGGATLRPPAARR